MKAELCKCVSHKFVNYKMYGGKPVGCRMVVGPAVFEASVGRGHYNISSVSVLSFTNSFILFLFLSLFLIY